MEQLIDGYQIQNCRMLIKDADLCAIAVLIAIRMLDFIPTGPIMLAISPFSNHQKAGIT